MYQITSLRYFSTKIFTLPAYIERSAVNSRCIRSFLFFFFSSRRRHTRLQGDWSSDVCSSDLPYSGGRAPDRVRRPLRPGHCPPAGESRPALHRPLPGIARPGAAQSKSAHRLPEIGRASCRERVEISVGAVSLKKKKKSNEDAR